MEKDIEEIKAVIAAKAERFKSRMGDVTLAGVENGVVRIAPSGYCWR
ncbi:MAG: hypothetical protein M0042_15680 [Nitrospiraceae bacterium]|nr:hypothetical protein [Nitrospiraceae bacterium]